MISTGKDCRTSSAAVNKNLEMLALKARLDSSTSICLTEEPEAAGDVNVADEEPEASEGEEKQSRILNEGSGAK